MEVFTYKVRRKSAGKNFPFDRIYLVKFDDRDYIERLFRHALVMPVEGELKELLTAEPPEDYIDHTQYRDDTASRTQTYAGGANAWKTFVNGDDWVMVVPLLTKFMKNAMPKYLMNARWFDGRRGEKRADAPSVMPQMTYLQTPEKKIRPVCVICPRFIEHQNGDCQLGQKVCYESLPLGLSNYMESAVPDPTPNIKDNDVDLQEDYA